MRRASEGYFLSFEVLYLLLYEPIDPSGIYMNLKVNPCISSVILPLVEFYLAVLCAFAYFEQDET